MSNRKHDIETLLTLDADVIIMWNDREVCLWTPPSNDLTISNAEIDSIKLESIRWTSGNEEDNSN